MKTKDRQNAMRRLFVWQEGLCAICWNEVEHPDPCRERGGMLEEDAPSIEHVVPASRGGGDRLENLLLTHKCCNEMRGNGKVCHAATKMWKRVAPYIVALRAEQKEGHATPIAA